MSESTVSGMLYIFSSGWSHMKLVASWSTVGLILSQFTAKIGNMSPVNF